MNLMAREPDLYGYKKVNRMKVKTFSLYLFGLLTLFALFIGCGENSGEKKYKKALSSWKQKDLVRAETLMEPAIRQLAADRKPVAYNQLGIIRWKLNKREEAIQAFHSAITGEITEANINLASALFYLDRLDEAEFQLTNILGARPRHAEARLLRGLVSMKRKDWDSAFRDLKVAEQQDAGNPAISSALILCELHKHGQSQQAINALQRLAAKHPNYTPAIYNIGSIYDHWLKRKDDALTWYRQYLQKAGDDGSYIEKTQKAIDRLNGAGPAIVSKDQGELARRYLTAGNNLHRGGKYEQAISQYKKATDIDPSQKTAWYNMSLSYYTLEQYDYAVQCCETALNIDPLYTDARYMLALSLYQNKKYSEARTELKSLLQANPDHTDGKNLLKILSRY